MNEQIRTIDAATLPTAVEHLCTADSDLARVVETLGIPPLWARVPGFPALIHIILEQQVSLASAQAAFDRLRSHTDPLTPENLLALNDDTLLACGVSRQKRVYIRGVARRILDGQLDLDALPDLPDAAVYTALTACKGIGPWTANIYLLMALRRADIWPAGDLALAVAAQEIKQLPQRPAHEALDAIAIHWQPWRAVAARILWHYYLNTVRKRRGDIPA